MSRIERKSRSTLQDIANRVGVTKMTVSRFLREPDAVAPKTRQKIAAVIAELGYIQNRAPAMLSKSSSKAIGIILPSLSNQVFANLVQGIEQVTKANGYATLIAHCGYNQHEEEEKIAFMLSYQVDGLILTETQHTDQTRKMLDTAGIPVVETMEIAKNPIDMVVGLDHEQAAFSVVSKMLASGKRHIAYLGARLDSRTHLRMQGYERAMLSAQCPTKFCLTEQHSSFTLGGELMEQLLSTYPQVDGIFCTNDDIAVGAMLKCISAGKHVPNDIAIVGYNALNIGQAVTPKLTSVITPRYEMGQKSAELLLAVLAGQTVEQKIYDLGFSLTSGESL